MRKCVQENILIVGDKALMMMMMIHDTYEVVVVRVVISVTVQEQCIEQWPSSLMGCVHQQSTLSSDILAMVMDDPMEYKGCISLAYVVCKWSGANSPTKKSCKW